jgi:peroxiredoxin
VAPIAPGTQAPEFVLRREDGKKVRREDLKGQTSVLVFYPAAFSPICTDQLNVYQEVLGEFETRGAKLYGVSCDSTWTQRAFREHLGVSIEQLSDWEPKGATCRAFGVYHEGGFPQRALVILDREGVVRWSYQAPNPGEIPGVNLIFDALDA